jgi:hypothetical protein
VLFGGNWSFVYHGAFPQLLGADAIQVWEPRGFNAVVDYIAPNREKRLFRIIPKVDLKRYPDPPLLKSHFGPPIAQRDFWRILRWVDKESTRAEVIKTTYHPTRRELTFPVYACLSADHAWQLAAQKWTPECER